MKKKRAKQRKNEERQQAPDIKHYIKEEEDEIQVEYVFT
jgi:hypothetical protein